MSVRRELLCFHNDLPSSNLSIANVNVTIEWSDLYPVSILHFLIELTMFSVTKKKSSLDCLRGVYVSMCTFLRMDEAP